MVVLTVMSDEQIVTIVWNMLVLKKRFERNPYALSSDELALLRDYDDYHHAKTNRMLS